MPRYNTTSSLPTRQEPLSKTKKKTEKRRAALPRVSPLLLLGRISRVTKTGREKRRGDTATNQKKKKRQQKKKKENKSTAPGASSHALRLPLLRAPWWS